MRRVSILMPMKNTAKWVGAAVDSILQQEFCDLELIVVDDRSTDGSAEVVRAISDERVRLLTGSGRGAAAALNVALEAASGDILLQCDSDDLVPPGRVGRQVRFLDSHTNFGAVAGSFSSMDADGRALADLWDRTSVAEEITPELLAGETRTSLCAFAIRRELLVALGGIREYFETGYDIDLQLRLAERARVWWEPRCEYRYRLHGASLTHTQASARRRFFEEYARSLRRQRAEGGHDDLQRGTPESPPVDDSRPDSHVAHVTGMLTGAAWQAHRENRKISALSLGARALAHSPGDFLLWKSMAALLLKPARAGKLP